MEKEGDRIGYQIDRSLDRRRKGMHGMELYRAEGVEYKANGTCSGILLGINELFFLLLFLRITVL